VTCAAVRDRLTERALGTLPTDEAATLDRHLRWCAACRKESDELTAAAAVMGFAAAPAAPDPALEDRVVSAVQAAAGSHPGHGDRRGRLAVAAVVAAMVAVLGLGWGAVMAGEAARSANIAQQVTLSQEKAAQRFAEVLGSVEAQDPKNRVALGTLSPHGGTGGGSAFTLVSPTIMDLAVVMMRQLPAPHAHTLPYTVRLLGSGLPTIEVSKIAKLDSGGDAMVSRSFSGSLAGYDRVEVRNALGRLVLSGTLGTRASLASPAP